MIRRAPPPNDDDDKRRAETERLAGCLGALLLGAAVVAARVHTLTSYWGWFAVPLGAPAIGPAHALGLAIMASYAIVNLNQDDENESRHREDRTKGSRKLWTKLFTALVLYGLGWALSTTI